MQNKTLKKCSMLALAGVLSVGMLAGSFSMDKVNAAATTTATITVGKTLTVNGTKFPNIENFTFKLEPVQGYKNPHVSTLEDGTKIAAGDVPSPGVAGTKGTTVTKTVGNFKIAGTGDTAVSRTRKDSFPTITYDTAGYYMYKLTEVVPTTKVPGVVYDESSYYVVVYVINETDSNGNTIPGVKVKSITAWHNDKNTAAANELKPNIKDIVAGGTTHNHDPNPNATNDNNTGDNNGHNPNANNTYGGGQTTTSNPASAQRWDGLGKVGISPATTPNILDATKFWNRQEMHDITVSKNVKGTLGDLTKQFEFTVELEGLEANQPYGIVKSSGAQVIEATDGTLDGSKTNVTSLASGKATVRIKMNDDQSFTIKNLPNSAKYKVTEAKSNHAPSYAITSSNTGTPGPMIKTASGNTNNAKETALATNQEIVDPSDGNITIAYTNTRNLETITGVPSNIFAFAVAGLIALVAFALYSPNRRRRAR